MKILKVKALCFLLAFSLLSCFVPAFAEGQEADSEQKTEVNYAQNENATYAYLTDDDSSNFFATLEDNNCVLLNDGIIPYKETPSETVAFHGTSRVVTVVFDLGAVYSDIKEIRFCGVWDAYNYGSLIMNRGFCGEDAIFRFSEDGVSYERNKNFVMTKENHTEDGFENGFYNFKFRFDENITAKTVELIFWSPVYVLSLGEIQIIGEGNGEVFPETSEPDASEPFVSDPDISGDSDTIISGVEPNGISWFFYTESGRMEFYGDGDIPKSSNSNWGQYKDDIKGIYVGDGITSIESFEGHTGIKFIQLGKSLSNEFSFADCVNLNKVIINSEIERINDYAFSGCSSLEILLFPDSLKNIGSYAFSSCENLKDVYLPSNLEVIESFAFSDCVTIEKVALPETVKELHWGAFINCSSLSEINIPKNIEFIESTFIADTAIYNDESNWTDGLLYIGNVLVDTEMYSSESEYIIKDGTERIASSAFYECMDLENVIIPESVKYIGSSAFSFCPNLKEVKLPTSLKEISDYLFSGCESLEKIVLPENIEKIGESAFSYCSSLTEIIIPEKVKTVEKYAFEGCGMLSKITINGALEFLGNGVFSGTPVLNKENYENGALYIGGILVDVLENAVSGEFDVKEETYLLANAAFGGCADLTNVIIPNTVKYIGDHCFFGCKGLRTLYIPKTVEKIGEGIFESASEYIVIKGELNSVSHAYSVENGIPFSATDESFEYNVDFENNLLPNITEKKTLEEIVSALGSIKAFDKEGNIIEDGKAFLGTGSVVKYPDGYTATVIVKGDVDGTAFINSTDYLIIKKCFLKEYEIKGVFSIAADVYSDGIINSTDYLTIKKHFLKIN